MFLESVLTSPVRHIMTLKQFTHITTQPFQDYFILLMETLSQFRQIVGLKDICLWPGISGAAMPSGTEETVCAAMTQRTHHPPTHSHNLSDTSQPTNGLPFRLPWQEAEEEITLQEEVCDAISGCHGSVGNSRLFCVDSSLVWELEV